MPALLVALALGWNLRRHLKGRSTICAWLRHIPWPVLRTALLAFDVWWFRHLRNGYRDTP